MDTRYQIDEATLCRNTVLMEELKEFVNSFEGPDLPLIKDSELEQVSIGLQTYATYDVNISLRAIQCLSYFTLDNSYRGTLSLRSIKDTIEILANNTNWNYDELLSWLIERLKPLLLKTGRSIKKCNKRENNALKPHVGSSYKEDELREVWRDQGKLRSIPFFYVVLLHLKNRHVSTNLWWITPGIINLLEDTTDLSGIRLKGVFLLRVFLENCFEDQKNWVSFSDLGLFELYGPIVWNLCYYLPPSYDSNMSLTILETVFPTLNSLYRLQFCSSNLKYRYHLGKFLSEILLQSLIPRVTFASEPLMAFALDICRQIVKILGSSSVVYLQRMIYILGEYLIRNPLLTAFTSLLLKTLDLIHTMILECPAERIIAHKYDFYGLLLISFKKCKQDGLLTENVEHKYKCIRGSLKAMGCNLDQDKDRILMHYGYMDEFFN